MSLYALNDIELCDAFGDWLVENGYHKTHCFTRTGFHHWATEMTSERPDSWTVESASQALANHRLARKRGVKRRHNFRCHGMGPKCRWFYAFPKDTPAMTQQTSADLAKRFATEAVCRIIPAAEKNHHVKAAVQPIIEQAARQFTEIVKMIEVSLPLKTNPDLDWEAEEVPTFNGV